MEKVCIMYVLCLVILFCSVGLQSDMNTLYLGARPISEPYLSGDTFRKFCDHVIDIKNPHFDPECVKNGDIIFLSKSNFNENPDCKFIDDFFKNSAPCIKNKYILVTHNSDLNITEQFKKYLDSSNLFVWFAQNVGFSHNKLIPIPIGLENELWGRKYVNILNSIRGSGNNIEKKYLLYMNFSTGTNSKERVPAYNYFKSQDFCHVTSRMSVEQYLSDVCKAKFIVSPHGNGLDCHRTWEALYLGVIPIVKKSSLDKLYEDLPVIIVNDWSEVTLEFLEKKYFEMSSSTYQMEKLYIAYWNGVFSKYKMLCAQ